MREVCKLYNIQVTDLYRKTRQRKISEPRMIVITLMRTALGYTLEGAGFEYGQTNASAVHAIKTIRSLFLTDKIFQKQFNQLLENLIDNELERDNVIERFLDETRKDERIYKEIFRIMCGDGQDHSGELSDRSIKSLS